MQGLDLTYLETVTKSKSFPGTFKAKRLIESEHGDVGHGRREHRRRGAAAALVDLGTAGYDDSQARRLERRRRACRGLITDAARVGDRERALSHTNPVAPLYNTRHACSMCAASPDTP